jgi:hypothetical protein
VLIGAAGALGAARVYAAVGPGPHRTVDELGGGRVRAAVSDGTHRVAIVGPASVHAGETATFAAETGGVAHALWIAPDGAVHVDAPELRVRTRSAGDATVTLVGVDGEGRQTTATHVLRVLG